MITSLVASVVAAISFGHSPLSDSSNDEAAPGVNIGFGQLVGPIWTCSSSGLQADGSWKDGPGDAMWLFQYVLDGHAVQDFWFPPEGSPGGPGTNLRTYDEDNDQWRMVWATSTQPKFDHFDATAADSKIVMTGERWARPSMPAHHSRITFFAMTDEKFDWKYEFSADGTDGSFTEQSRISCRR